MDNDNLYMFAIVPPADLGAKIHKERLTVSENYQCVKALKPPVHITLYEPFTEDDDFKTRVTALQQWAGRQVPFQVSTDNYGFFENPAKPVFIIKVVKDDSITQLRTGLLRELKKYIYEPDTELLANGKPIPRPKPQPFNPHFTLAYRDLPPEKVPTIKQDYARRTFKASFLCSSIYLWRHNGSNWQVQQAFELKGLEAGSNAPTLFG